MIRSALALHLGSLPCVGAITLLSCLYGQSPCLGLQPGDGFEKAKELGCPVSESGDFFGAQQSGIESQLLAPPHALRDSKGIPYGDGMPCTFAPGDDLEELASLELTDIEIKMSDGTVRHPSGATYRPAVERNELLTLLLLGDFGRQQNLTMTSVTIKGSRYDGAGLEYDNTGSDLVFARWFDVDAHLELENEGSFLQDVLRGPTHCGAQFSTTTHVVQVAFNGGMTVAFDGLLEMPFDLDALKHKQMFKLMLGGSGTVLSDEQFLGLADEHDGDNFVDLCLRLSSQDVESIAADTGGLMLRLLSTRECNFLVAPKGDCLNDLVTADCGDSSARPQEICVSGIPGGKFACDPKSQPTRQVTLTPAEIDSLTDCQYITIEKGFGDSMTAAVLTPTPEPTPAPMGPTPVPTPPAADEANTMCSSGTLALATALVTTTCLVRRAA